MCEVKNMRTGTLPPSSATSSSLDDAVNNASAPDVYSPSRGVIGFTLVRSPVKWQFIEPNAVQGQTNLLPYLTLHSHSLLLTVRSPTTTSETLCHRSIIPQVSVNHVRMRNKLNGTENGGVGSVVVLTDELGADGN